MVEGWLESIARIGGRERPAWVAFSAPLLAVALLTALVYPLRDVFSEANLSLLYVLLLFGIGLAFGTGAAVASAVLAFLLTDYFFYEPRYTLFLDKIEHTLGLLILLVIGVSSGVLASRLRRQAEEARRETHRASMLYELNRALTTDVTLEQVLTSIVRGVVEIYGARGSRLLVRQDDDAEDFTVVVSWPAGDLVAPDREMLHMARHAAETGAVVGRGGAGRRVMLPHGVARGPRELRRRAGDDLVYVPVGAGEERLGVLEVSGRPGGGIFREDDTRILTSFADQAALAVQRARLVEQVTRTRVLETSNELKTALLAAVSHDLRTPLAAIKMSASALRDPDIQWDDAARVELLAAIEESTDWLALVVDNLLDLSRIEGGALRPDRDWHDLSDLLQHALEQMERQTARHRVALEIADDLPLVWLDYVQVSQVMTNLIGNAVKYSEPGTAIEIAATPVEEGAAVELRVTDHGRGIPRASLPHIFETFYRVKENGDVPGSGVGLAICKGLVEAHGGTIGTESRVGQGTTIRVRLPVAPEAPAGDGKGEG
jgi:two-component system sensor histidine kinase KdpD